jgi:hypothetical protein
MITLQRFNEANPPTVAQLNLYFESMASAINTLSGQQVIQFLGADDSPNLYAQISGAAFTGAISAPLASLGSPLFPVPTVSVGETAPDLGEDPEAITLMPRFWYQPTTASWFIWHVESEVGQWVEILL